MKYFFNIIFLTSLLIACSNNLPILTQQKTTLFTDQIAQGIIINKAIDEASGLAASPQNGQVLWTHNDSGSDNKIFLIGTDAKDKATFSLNKIVNRDWEDIATCSINKISYIYVAEIGDNNAVYTDYYIYRFKEPNTKNIANITNFNIDDIDTIHFRYEDGSRDAETLMVDPKTQNIYVVSKRELKSRLYVIRFPYSTTEMNTAKFITEFSFNGATSGDISPTGKEVLIRNYGKVFYWKKNGNETIEELLKTVPIQLPYTQEPQGEAIAWKLDESGYFTISEQLGNTPATLFFYKRN